MIRIINYFLQSILIYIFFIIGRILGLKISRKIFSTFFSTIGPFFKSKNIVKNNLNIFSQNLSNFEEKKIISNMWKNYGMTFIEYIFLNYFKKKNSHISIEGKEYLSKIIQDRKPVIFVSGHFANFELMSMEIIKKKNSPSYNL